MPSRSRRTISCNRVSPSGPYSASSRTRPTRRASRTDGRRSIFSRRSGSFVVASCARLADLGSGPLHLPLPADPSAWRTKYVEQAHDRLIGVTRQADRDNQKKTTADEFRIDRTRVSLALAHEAVDDLASNDWGSVLHPVAPKLVYSPNLTWLADTGYGTLAALYASVSFDPALLGASSRLRRLAGLVRPYDPVRPAELETLSRFVAADQQAPTFRDATADWRRMADDLTGRHRPTGSGSTE